MVRTYLPFYIGKRGLLAAIIAAAFSPHAFALTLAGKIDFAFGKVTATGTNGAARPLVKGAEVFSGDSIATTDGRVQIRFTDGAYMSLQPNTVFKVDEYAFNGKLDDKEKGSFSLVKGGLRTITGAIGKVNKQNYEVRTPTATIGIRGTSYAANQSDDGLVVTVAQGLVSVSNQGGNVTLGTGQSVLVRTSTSSPEMTDQRASADHIVSQSQQQETQDEQQQDEQQLPIDTVTASGDQRTSTGSSVPLAQITSTALPESGPGYGVAWAYGAGAPTVDNNVTATFSGSNLVDFNGGTGNLATSYEVQNAGWDGLIGWGRWITHVDGTAPGGGQDYPPNGGLHYVTGKMSPQAAVNLRANTTATYNLVGATAPITNNGGTITLGTFSGSLAVNFDTVNPRMTMNASIVDSAAGINYNLANFGAISLGAGPLQTTFTANSSISSGPSINLTGMFVGSNAERLGIAYEMNSSLGHTSGAAAFAVGAVTTNPLPPP